MTTTYAPDVTPDLSKKKQEYAPGYKPVDYSQDNQGGTSPRIFDVENIPYYTSIGQKHFDLENDVVPHIQELMNKDPYGQQYSNVHGWQSKAYFDLEETPWMTEICKKTLELMTKVYPEYGIPLEPQITSFWFGVNGRGHYNLAHTHPHNFFGGVLYLKVPSGNCGDLVFERPDSMWQQSIQGSIITDRNVNHFYVEPQKNMFVVFPAHVRHYVLQNLTNDTDDQRICVAFNFK